MVQDRGGPDKGGADSTWFSSVLSQSNATDPRAILLNLGVTLLPQAIPTTLERLGRQAVLAHL